MKNFLVLFSTSPACDYSGVGCGKSWEFFEAEDREAAMEKLRHCWGGIDEDVGIVRYYCGEQHLDNIILVEVASEQDVSKELIALAEAELKAKKERVDREKKLAEFKRLQKELGL